MKIITSEEAQQHLPQFLEEANISHEPIQITGSLFPAVLIAESDWRSIQETLHLLSIPGMRESICEGINTPISECATELPW